MRAVIVFNIEEYKHFIGIISQSNLSYDIKYIKWIIDVNTTKHNSQAKETL